MKIKLSICLPLALFFLGLLAAPALQSQELVAAIGQQVETGEIDAVQQPTAPTPIPVEDESSWYILDYMKVKPGMYDKYLDCEAVWKMVHKERQRLGLIDNWELFQVRYPSGTSTEYDFVTVTTVNGGWNAVGKLDSAWGDAFKVVPKDKIALVENTENYRDFVKSEVLASIDRVFASGDASANFIMVNFMDVPDGRWDEYVAMETELAKPVHQMNVDAGKRVGWGLYGVVLPYGANMPYQAIAVDFYNKWSDIGSSVEGAWKKAHPDLSEGYIDRQISETRTMVKAELWILKDQIR